MDGHTSNCKSQRKRDEYMHEQQPIIFTQTVFFSKPYFKLKQYVINKETGFLKIKQVIRFNISYTLFGRLNAEISDTLLLHHGLQLLLTGQTSNLDLPLKTLHYNSLKTRFYTTSTLKKRLRNVYIFFTLVWEKETQLCCGIFPSVLAAVTAYLKKINTK